MKPCKGLDCRAVEGNKLVGYSAAGSLALDYGDGDGDFGGDGDGGDSAEELVVEVTLS